MATVARAPAGGTTARLALISRLPSFSMSLPRASAAFPKTARRAPTHHLELGPFSGQRIDPHPGHLKDVSSRVCFWAQSSLCRTACQPSLFDPEADVQGARQQSSRAGHRPQRNGVRGDLSAGVFDRLSQHLVKLLLAELLGRLPLRCVPRHLLCDWTGASCRRRPQLRGRPYLGPCRGRLVASLQALTCQHAADRVTTASEPTRYLRRALS